MLFRDETAWLIQRALAALFRVNVPAITKHLKNIFESGELDRAATVSKMAMVQSEGGRDVLREVTLYNLDAIIAVGYLHDSPNAVVYIVAVWDAPKTGVPVLIDPRRRTPPQ